LGIGLSFEGPPFGGLFLVEVWDNKLNGGIIKDENRGERNSPLFYYACNVNSYFLFILFAIVSKFYNCCTVSP